jgi:hypothetical protein
VKAFILCLAALLAGQMITRQSKPIVRLKPSQAVISSADGGKLVELLNSAATINLPGQPPKVDAQGNPWGVDVKNFGPQAVNIVGNTSFTTKVNVNQTVHIYSSGSTYILKQE